MEFAATEGTFNLNAQILYSHMKSLMVRNYLYMTVWNGVAVLLLISRDGLKESKENYRYSIMWPE